GCPWLRRGPRPGPPPPARELPGPPARPEVAPSAVYRAGPEPTSTIVLLGLAARGRRAPRPAPTDGLPCLIGAAGRARRVLGQAQPFQGRFDAVQPALQLVSINTG